MNIRVRDRIALALYSLLAIGGSVALGWYAVFKRGFDIESLILCGVALLGFVFGICTLRMAFRHRKRKDRNSVTVQNNEHGNGEVRVSVQALDALVKQAIVGHTDGVADIKTRIINHEDSISVKIEMSLNGDVHIPNITLLLQGTIKSFIEEFSGIAVRDVSIMVNTIIPVTPQLAMPAQAAPEVVVLTEEEHAELPVAEISRPQEEAAAQDAQEETAESDVVFAEEAQEVCEIAAEETAEEPAEESLEEISDVETAEPEEKEEPIYEKADE